MGHYLLSQQNVRPWLTKLLEKYAVFLPKERESQVHWHRLETKDLETEMDFMTPAQRRIRASEPVKSFMFQSRQRVGSFPEPLVPDEPGPRVLLGIKNCDLVPLRVHDKILGEGEFKDPFYLARRKSTILVAADCPVPEQSCFCNLLGLTPYAQEGADATLSIVNGDWLFETGHRGEELIGTDSDLFAGLADYAMELTTRSEQRKAAVEMLNIINPKPWNPDLPGAIAARLHDHAFWQKHAETCVECFGCLMGCPTCYCFILYDQYGLGTRSDSSTESVTSRAIGRTRAWDACYEAAYARVGGGANPRAEFIKRFANRFDCKWKEFKRDHGMYACSGCGRCLKACMGRIDIRNVLGEL